MSKLANLTLLNIQSCGIGACPAIFKSENDTYVLIGKHVAKEAIPEDKIGEGEMAIEVPVELLDSVFELKTK